MPHIAMWSGPRNISTAMMRAWDARPDTFVCDEPLYAHYLAVTGLDHPGADEVIAHHEIDWRAVVEWLTGPIPNDASIFYQKHMAHHLLDDIELDWVDRLTNVMLIREPREMLTSLARVLPNPTVGETGLPQQVALFERVQGRTGSPPVVIDSRDVLLDPREMLAKLCDAIDVPYMDAMLNWKPGRRDTDGIWARHWYAAVEQSTGFGPYKRKNDPVPEHLANVLTECESLYEQLHACRIV